MMLPCSHGSDKKAGQNPDLLMKTLQENKCYKFNSFCLQSAGFHFLRYTKCHNSGERVQ